jgi:5'-3' exonuclease
MGAAVPDVVDAYCKALSWTLKYYWGGDVDSTWYYPWFLPPLFSDVAAAIRSNPDILQLPSSLSQERITPMFQLAMVLPVSSFGLLPAGLRELPEKHPWAWPVAWGTFAFGRRFLWECEPLIPLIRPAQILKWIREDLGKN